MGLSARRLCVSHSRRDNETPAMTAALALLVGGGLVLLAGLRNQTLSNILKGITDPVPVADAQPGTVAATAQKIPQKGAVGGTGVDNYGGKPVCDWIVEILKNAKATGLWKGTVTSGYRSPAYSQSLCQHMCGAPSCPGRCAGVTSNHGGCTGGKGAVDVTDEAGFRRAMAALGNPLRNDLPSDTGHFSRDGH
jgi:hypothetical protein